MEGVSTRARGAAGGIRAVASTAGSCERGRLSIVRGGTARRAVRGFPRGGAPDSAVSERVRGLPELRVTARARVTARSPGRRSAAVEGLPELRQRRERGGGRSPGAGANGAPA